MGKHMTSSQKETDLASVPERGSGRLMADRRGPASHGISPGRMKDFPLLERNYLFHLRYVLLDDPLNAHLQRHLAHGTPAARTR